ncbi:outer membrane protein assembly factor BamB family protein [Paenibacillus sonchi]|uniref:outer membrane protein assembly factor BamB family protein n=1 Tax=Paenibacillus sonchi TaxID=373687 RepID=UPI001E3912B4|nr:PQQ-binding-like beta-propeller repeat protein [Paenibacillus sonchi]MCE3203315.1 PQQ-binding-like beta-propeller repeat protein [Paenibacillus sonchi]
MKKLQIRQRACAIIAGLSLLFAPYSVHSAWADSHTSYVGNNSDYDWTATTPAAKTVWTQTMDVNTAAADYETMNQGSAVTGGGKAYVIQKGQAVAINVQTGKVAWKYGAKLLGPLLYQKGVVYARSEGGTIYAVHADTGRNKWSSTVKAKGKLSIDQDQLYAADSDIMAFRLGDGKFLWKDNYSETLFSPLVFQGNLVFAQNSVSGAYTLTVLHAFDRTTGKHLWEADNQALPLTAANGTVLSQRLSNLIDLVPLTTLDSLDAKTGKRVKTAEYNPKNIDPVNPEPVNGVISSGGRAWLLGGQIYIGEGNSLYSYPLEADPSKVKAMKYTASGSGLSLDYAAGPYDGRVFFRNAQAVYGIKTANQSPVPYPSGGQIARFDLLGHGMYLAEPSGKLVAINLLTAKPVLQLQTSGRVFGPTLLESGMIIVQSKGKLTAFKEPESLRKQ